MQQPTRGDMREETRVLRIRFAITDEFAPALPLRSDDGVTVHEADMAAVPRVGEWVTLGMDGIWRVNEVIWRVKDRLTRKGPDVDIVVEPLDDDACAIATHSDLVRAQEDAADA